MVAIKKLFSLATVVGVAYALSPRASPVQTVLDDIKQINTAIDAVADFANHYDGGFFKAVLASPKVVAIDNAMIKTTKDAAALSGITISDGEKLLAAITSLGEPVTDLIAAVVAKQPQIQASQLDYVILLYLKNIRTDMDALADALIAQAPNDAVKAGGEAFIKTLDQAIKTAAQSFNDPIETILQAVGQLLS